MIITRKWLEEFIDLKDISDNDLTNALNSIGLEVANVKNIDLDENLVIGKILHHRPHENSDHLNICSVDVGADAPLQIICGAKNVSINALVCVALIGATMPSGLKIKQAKLRGVDSFGMICSATELGFNKVNEGILILNDSYEGSIGTKLREIFNDTIIEVELTPNRGDCLSVYGIARDLSAYFGISLRQNVEFVDIEGSIGIARMLSVHSKEGFEGFNLSYKLIENSLIRVDTIKLLRLAEADILTDNNLMNLINYAMQSTGVIIKAYDYKKISSDCEKIALEIKKEKFNNYGVYYQDNLISYIGLNQVDNYKASSDSELIIIECSYINPSVISKAIFEDEKLIKDETSYKSSRGSEPDLLIGQNFLFNMLKSNDLKIFAGSQNIDTIKDKTLISVDEKDITKLIGEQIDKNEIVAILKRLGFEVAIEQNLINIKVPNYRHDIKNFYDISEEIVRIYGIDKITPKPLKFVESPRINDCYRKYKMHRALKTYAMSAGFYECINYVFDNQTELMKFGFSMSDKILINPINNELNFLRNTLLNHLIKNVISNTKNYKKSIKLFEIGSTFDNVGEHKKMAFVISGLKNDANIINKGKPEVVDFYYFANLLHNIIGDFEILKTNEYSFLNPFEQGHIKQNGKTIGYIGNIDLRFNPDLMKSYVCEIDLDLIENLHQEFHEFSKFPPVSRDLSLVVNKDISYTSIKDEILSLGIKDLKKFNPIDIYSDESLGDNISLTINFTFQNLEKTLVDEDIEKQMNLIINHLKDKLNITLR